MSNESRTDIRMVQKVDQAIGYCMACYGHVAHRLSLGGLFIWFGLLKQFGHETTTSLLAHTIYFGSPEVMVPLLGWWEVAIGLCLCWRKLNRVALLLLAIRLPGTALALILQADVCFTVFPIVPTPEGQYLIKDIALFTAAMVIGGTLLREHPEHVYH